MTLRLRISPCPNDTFMFDALLNGRIDTGGLHFDVEYRDIEALNRGVQAGDADVSKISCAVLPAVADRYALLDSGAALGRGNGPLLVRRASDLLSMFVGEVEKNIARAFREAEDDGALLLIDEVDSFLQDRRGAQRSWEVTQVNEMLTQMEGFAGVFIASTNLLWCCCFSFSLLPQ